MQFRDFSAFADFSDFDFGSDLTVAQMVGGPGTPPGSGYHGKRIGDIPPEDMLRLAQWAAQFDAPPPRSGHLGYVLLPWATYPYRFNFAILVRSKASERAYDLGALRSPDVYPVAVHPRDEPWRAAWRDPNRVMSIAQVVGQRDWGILGTGITAKQVAGGALAVAGATLVATGVGGPAGAALASSGAKLATSKAKPGALPAEPTPLQLQREMERQSQEIRAAGGVEAAFAGMTPVLPYLLVGGIALYLLGRRR